jgi:ribose 5-phosphate isomerase B
MGRSHNDANVLALAGRKVAARDAGAIVAAFLGAEFEGGRHQRRVDQIAGIESGELPNTPVQAAKEAS